MQKLAFGQRPQCHPAIAGYTEKLQLLQGFIFLQQTSGQHETVALVVFCVCYAAA